MPLVSWKCIIVDNLKLKWWLSKILIFIDKYCVRSIHYNHAWHIYTLHWAIFRVEQNVCTDILSLTLKKKEQMYFITCFFFVLLIALNHLDYKSDHWLNGAKTQPTILICYC